MARTEGATGNRAARTGLVLAIALAVSLLLAVAFSPGRVLAQTGQADDADHRTGSNAPTFEAPQNLPRYAPDRVIVGLEKGAGEAALEDPKDETGAKESFEINGGRVEVLRLPESSGTSAVEAVEAFSDAPSIAYAERDAVLVPAATRPNDPSYRNLWGIENTAQFSGSVADADSDILEAWTLGKGAGATVGVIDSGVDVSHPDLKANLWQNPGEIAGNGVDDDNNGKVDDVHGWDFAAKDATVFDANESSHGTHVAGTVAAVANNGVGVAGVAPDAKVASLKFITSAGSGYTSDAAAALDYAVAEGIPISNNSYGCAGDGCYSLTLKNAVERANLKGHLFVASAGNGGTDAVGDDNDVTPSYPASITSPNVLSVAATGYSDERAPFSNYGATSVDIGAPGRYVYSTVPGGYGYMSGTSMASPHVSGVAALAKGLSPASDAAAMKKAILDSADPVPSMQGETVSGGRLNATTTLNMLAPGVEDEPELPVAEPVDTALSLNPSAVSVTYGQQVTLGGRLVADGTSEGLGGRKVVLERAAISGDSFARFAEVTTADDGTFSHSFKPDRGYQYRAVFSAELGQTNASTSSPSTVGVAAVVKNYTSTTNLKLGYSRSLYGHVAPYHAGQTARIVVYRQGYGVVARYSPVLSDSSTFKRVYKPGKKATYEIRVSFPGDADHGAANGPTRVFKVY